MMLVALILYLMAFVGFALSKPNHYKEVMGCRPSTQGCRQLNLLSWVLLSISFVLAIKQSGAYGSLEILGYMTFSVLLLVSLLALRPTWLRSLFYLLPAALIVSLLI